MYWRSIVWGKHIVYIFDTRSCHVGFIDGQVYFKLIIAVILDR